MDPINENNILLILKDAFSMGYFLKSLTELTFKRLP